MKNKIDWNKDSHKNARLAINDGVMTSYVSEEQLAEKFSLHEIAEAYASTYDHSGENDSYAVCKIEDTDDGEAHTFAFDGNGKFEWDTDRQFLVA
jgi:hypothetical protein